jgi:hydrogenase 3 maturation protease
MEKNQIREFLKDAKKIAVIGIGSELRSDDWAGCLISSKLKAKKAQVYTSETTPENFVFASDCSHVILIDAAHLSQPPGSIGYFEDPSIIGETNTHKATTLFMKYLKNSGCRTLLIAIEPQNLEFGGEMSEAVKKAAERVKKELEEALN